MHASCFEVTNKTFRTQWVYLRGWGTEGEEAKGQKKLEKKKRLKQASSHNFIRH